MTGLDLCELVLVVRIVRLLFDLCTSVCVLIIARCSFWREKSIFCGELCCAWILDWEAILRRVV